MVLWGIKLEDSAKWSKGAVGPLLKAIEDFTKEARRLAAHIEDGTIELTEEEKRGLLLALQAFEVQADLIRLELPGPGGD